MRPIPDDVRYWIDEARAQLRSKRSDPRSGRAAAEGGQEDGTEENRGESWDLT